MHSEQKVLALFSHFGVLQSEHNLYTKFLFVNKCGSGDIELCLLVGCLMSQQHASVSQGRICSDNFMCCHTEINVADQTFHLTQSQYNDTRLTTDPITPGAWQGSHWSANFLVTGMTRSLKNLSASEIRTRDLLLSNGDALTTRPTRWAIFGCCNQNTICIQNAQNFFL